ncbi:MAG: hypothetical protein KatS3mg101_0834 [Patescibacteria group bacterium]|nr:MAG: hypothetical protein KatS3mg101_0834 [Patescibacteria group bacterium]
MNSLILDFVNQNKTIIYGTVILSSISNIIDIVIIPNYLVDMIKNVNKKTVRKFLTVVVIQKLFYISSNYFGNKIEPLLYNHTLREIAKRIVEKEMVDFTPTEAIDKAVMISSSVNSAFYYVFIKMIPLIAVSVVAFIRVFKFNYKIWVQTITSLVIFAIILYFINSKDDNLEIHKDVMLKAVDNIIQNIDFITSTRNGVDLIKEEVDKVTIDFRDSILKIVNNDGKKQSLGISTGVLFYAFTVLYMLRLLRKKEIDQDSFGKNIVVIGRLYNFFYDMGYYTPKILRVFSILKSNRQFLQELFKKEEKKKVDIKNGSILFSNVTFSYGDKIIFNNYSTYIADKEKVNIVGHVGSGKSTFINLIRGKLKPVSGNIFLGGENVNELDRESINVAVSIAKQNPGVLLSKTVYEIITFGIKGDNLRQKVEEIIKRYDLGELVPLDKQYEPNVDELSGGQKQLIHILHSVLNPDMKVLILDEPTSSLDKLTKEKVIRLIKDIDATVIMITHDEVIFDKTLVFPVKQS